jgi:hypothetical protein
VRSSATVRAAYLGTDAPEPAPDVRSGA